MDEEKTSDIILNDDKHFTAYVDGSYNDVEKSVGCGVIMFSFGEARKEAFAVSGNDLISMRNVAGEIKAAWWAMEYAIENNAETLDIYHDYEGVAKWCTGAWKANLPETMRYRDYYKSIEGKLKVTFHKVKGHSGNEYNEMADKLAKSACNIAD